MNHLSNDDVRAICGRYPVFTTEGGFPALRHYLEACKTELDAATAAVEAAWEALPITQDLPKDHPTQLRWDQCDADFRELSLLCESMGRNALVCVNRYTGTRTALTTKEAALRLGIHRSGVQRLIRLGRLTATVEENARGPVYHVSAASVDAFQRLPAAGWPKGKRRKAPP